MRSIHGKYPEARGVPQSPQQVPGGGELSGMGMSTHDVLGYVVEIQVMSALRQVSNLAIMLCILVGSRHVALSQSTQTDTSGIPREMRYDGILERTERGAAANRPEAVVGVEFAIYSDQYGGVPLWHEIQNVTVDSEGRYTVYLGSASSEGLPPGVFLSGQAAWLGIKVQGYAETRIQLSSVAYSLKSLDASLLGGVPAEQFVRVDQFQKKIAELESARLLLGSGTANTGNTGAFTTSYAGNSDGSFSPNDPLGYWGTTPTVMGALLTTTTSGVGYGIANGGWIQDSGNGFGFGGFFTGVAKGPNKGMYGVFGDAINNDSNAGHTNLFLVGVGTGFEHSGAGTVNTAAGFEFDGAAHLAGTLHNAFGFMCGNTPRGLGDTLNACFYSPDAQNGASDYSFYSAGGKNRFLGSVSAGTFKTESNCANSDGICGSAAAGAVTIAAGATTVTVFTAAVTAASRIMVTENSTLGAALGVTCNTTVGRTYTVTKSIAGTSFAITTSAVPVINPACLTYTIVN
jgi:hypothetical protein